MKTIFEHLNDHGVAWAYYDHDIAFLRVFKKFRLETGAIDGIDEFYSRCSSGTLPAVSWIDPNFQDFGTHGGDDHPPSDIRLGQQLVGRVYNALLAGAGDLWSHTMLIITYDEHGGFFDHAVPPECADDRPGFRRLGLRVPALVVSPWAERGHVQHETFDHTSILKTILKRFCTDLDGALPDMGRRVNNARDLGGTLSADSMRTDATPAPAVEIPDRARARPEPNEFQELMAVRCPLKS